MSPSGRKLSIKWRPHLGSIYNLRVALLAYVLIPVIVVVAIVGSWALRALEQQVDQRMQEDIELIARAIRLPLSHALERDRIGSINQALDSAFTIDVVYGAYVYNQDGQQIASSGLPHATVQTAEAASIAQAGDRLGEFSRAGDEVIFSYFVPLTDTGGRINGLLQVTRRGSDFSDYIALVRGGALIALVSICLILAALVLFGHYGAVGRHLRKITSGMTQINVGQTGRRLSDKGPMEMRVLSRGINDMLDRIHASQLEIEKRQAQETELRLRLQESEKLAAIGQLASGVAHELGTPLSTVDGKAQQALRRQELSEPLQACLQDIRTEAGRMEKIIQQLLDFGRRNPLQRVKIDCGALIRAVLEKMEHEIQQREIQVSMPDSNTQDLLLEVDPIRFEQAIGNLLINAVQACRNQLIVSWSKDGDEVTISVEDDGPGISAEHLPYLFDPFFTTKAVGQGTGLGLSVAHAAILDHDGSISVERSEALGGALFRIRLKQ